MHFESNEKHAQPILISENVLNEKHEQPILISEYMLKEIKLRGRRESNMMSKDRRHREKQKTK